MATVNRKKCTSSYTTTNITNIEQFDSIKRSAVAFLRLRYQSFVLHENRHMKSQQDLNVLTDVEIKHDAN